MIHSFWPESRPSRVRRLEEQHAPPTGNRHHPATKAQGFLQSESYVLALDGIGVRVLYATHISGCRFNIHAN